MTLPTDLPVLRVPRPGRLRGVAGGGARDRARRVREARQEGRRGAVGDLRGAGRVVPVLRLDRRAVQPARREVLPAAPHPAAGPQRLVAEERRRRRGADPRRPDAPRRARRRRRGAGRRAVGARLRGLGHDHRAGRPRRGPGRRARGAEGVRGARRGQPLRRPLAGAHRRVRRDAREADHRPRADCSRTAAACTERGRIAERPQPRRTPHRKPRWSTLVTATGEP